MFHFWKSAKVYAPRATVMDFGLLKICLCALGIVLGVTVPRKKKVQTGILASGVFVATCLPLMNKFLDISDELAAAKQEK